jgi:hypothetical protein
LVTAAGGWLIAVAGPIPQHAHRSFRQHRALDVDGLMPPGTLDTPIQFCRFLGRYGVRTNAADPVTYLRQFRLSLEEFQRRGWSGDCNDFANAICDAGYHQGYPMGLVSVWPRDWRDRLSKDWHQLAVLCLQRDRDYLIFEFGQVIRWKGTLQAYAESIDKEILPVGGVLDWRPTRPHPLARLVDHLRLNARLIENTLPLDRPQDDPLA